MLLGKGCESGVAAANGGLHATRVKPRYQHHNWGARVARPPGQP